MSLPIQRPSLRTARHAFSLVELSVVIVIIAIVAVMGLEGTAIYMNRTAYKVTQQRLEAIDKALVAYKRVNGRLPCPAYATLAITDACFGKESWNNAGVRTCSAPPVPVSCYNHFYGTIMFGEVPVRDLGLPLNYMIDGYGARIRYMTTINLGGPPATYNATAPSIHMRSGKLDTSCTAGAPILCQDLGDAAYVILSHGRDKRGSNAKAGAGMIACSDGSVDTTRIDTQNCRFGIGAAVPGYVIGVAVPSDVIYDSRYNTGNIAANYFDDVVVWRKKSDL